MPRTVGGNHECIELLHQDGNNSQKFSHISHLVPGHVGGGGDHVVAVPARDGHEGDGGGVVADLLDEALDLLLDLLEPGLGVGRLGGVHLVDGHDELLDAEGVGEQGVLPGLPVLGDTGLELTGA